MKRILTILLIALIGVGFCNAEEADSTIYETTANALSGRLVAPTTITNTKSKKIKYKAFYETDLMYILPDDDSGSIIDPTQSGFMMNITTSQGVQFCDIFFLGASTGLCFYKKIKQVCFPLLIDCRVNFLKKKKFIPYAGIRLGQIFYTDSERGVCLETLIGCKMRIRNGKHISLAFAYMGNDNIYDFIINSVGAHIGYEF